MFGKEILDYILHGREETYLEYKESMNWSDKYTKLKIIQAMLALSNNKDPGGVIVVGVKEDNGRYSPAGMTTDDFNSFNYDNVASVVKNYSDPVIEFKLLSDKAKTLEGEKNFIVIQVSESKKPTICIKNDSFKNDNFSCNLRQNAIYIRSKAPIESREIATTHEWRELIERAVEKDKQDLFRRMPCFDGLAREIPSNTEKHNQDLTNDGL